MAQCTSCEALSFLHGAQQWMLMFPRILVHLYYFSFCYFCRIDATYCAPFVMNCEHGVGRPLLIHTKKLNQYINDKIHRGVIVVIQNHLVHWRGLQLTFIGNLFNALLMMFRHTHDDPLLIYIVAN